MNTNKKVTNLDWLNEDTFVCSDHHFGHKNILTFEPCRATAMRIDGYEDHTEWLIARHNETVSKDDTVLFIGDLAFNGVPQVLPRLNGKKYLILGNHDKKGNQVYSDMEGVISGELLIDYNQHGNTDMLHYMKPEDPLFSGIIKEFNEQNYMFTHYALFNDDDWDRQNKKIYPRIEKFQEYYDSFCCVGNVHGHLHSNKSTFKDSINISLEHIDFTPKRLKDLL